MLPRTVQLQEGGDVTIREAEKKDAPNMLVYMKQVTAETDFLAFGVGDFTNTLQEEETFVETSRNAPNKLALIAECGGRVIGVLSVSASSKERLKHSGEFGVSVLKAYWGKGIGSILICEMLDWARTSGVIRKINLYVRSDNDQAISLYEKYGFVREGVFRRSFSIRGKFYDSLMMGILID